MKDQYFEREARKNKSIFMKLATAVFNGLLFITTLRIDEDPINGGYRLTMFFNRKKDKWAN